SAIAKMKRDGELEKTRGKVESNTLLLIERRYERPPRGKWDLPITDRKKVRKIAFDHDGDPLGFAIGLDSAGFSWLVQPDFKTCAAAVEAKHPYWSTKLRKLQSNAKRSNFVR